MASNLNNQKIEHLNNAKNNSVKTRKRNYVYIKLSSGKGVRVSEEFIKGSLAVILSVVIAASSIITTGFSNLNKDSEISEFLRDNYGYVYSENKHPMNNGTTGFWLDTYDMAKDVQKTDNPDLALYYLYRNMEYKENNFDSVFSALGEEYKTFDEYLVSKGFVDKDGNPSREKYEEAMELYTRTKLESEKLTEEYGITK